MHLFVPREHEGRTNLVFGMSIPLSLQRLLAKALPPYDRVPGSDGCRLSQSSPRVAHYKRSYLSDMHESYFNGLNNEHNNFGG